MPINKNAYLRYQTLDKCFRNRGRNFFLSDLLEEVNKTLEENNPKTNGVSRRQIFDDIKIIEKQIDPSVTLERIRDGKKVYYRYSDLNYSLYNRLLNVDEAEKIKSALLVLSKFKGTPQFEWVNELIPKLEQSFGFMGTEKEIISFDANIYLKGIEYLGELFNAILYKKVLAIDYKSFKSKTNDVIEFHPYYLKQYNNRWFIFGFNCGVSKILNLALDRIGNIKELDRSFIENTEFDFHDYFEEIIGVSKTVDEKPIVVKLLFNADQAPYVLTKPLHGSQKVKENNENGLLITIEVIPNFELEKLILSFGNSVEVLSPSFFKERIIANLKSALNNY